MAKRNLIYLMPKGSYTQVILENAEGERFDITTFLRQIDASISASPSENSMTAHFAGEMLYVDKLPEQPAPIDWSEGFPTPWKDGFSTGKLAEKHAMINCYDHEGWKLWRKGRKFYQHCVKKWGEGDSARKNMDYLAGYRAGYSCYLEWVMTGATSAKANPFMTASDRIDHGRGKDWQKGYDEAVAEFPLYDASPRDHVRVNQSPVFEEGYRTCYEWREMVAAFNAGEGPEPNKPSNPYATTRQGLATLHDHWNQGWFHCLEYPSVAQAPKPRQR